MAIFVFFFFDSLNVSIFAGWWRYSLMYVLSGGAVTSHRDDGVVLHAGRLSLNTCFVFFSFFWAGLCRLCGTTCVWYTSIEDWHLCILYMGVSKNRGFSPKIDGENNGTPHSLMDDLGGKPTINGNTHIAHMQNPPTSGQKTLTLRTALAKSRSRDTLSAVYSLGQDVGDCLCVSCPADENGNRKEETIALRITGPCYRGVWMCIAGVWDLQTTTFEIPWFLGWER